MNNALIGIEWEPQFTLLEYPNRPVDFIPLWSSDHQINSIKISPNGKQISVLIREAVFKGYLFKKYTYEHSYISTDPVKRNLEVRTYPVPVEDLPNQIQKCNRLLHKFILKMKQYTSDGIGVFLPKAILEVSDVISFYDEEDHRYKFVTHHIPSKHVSISFSDAYNYSNKGIKLDGLNDLSQQLFHLKEYNELNSFRSFIKSRFSTIDYNRRIHITVPYNFTDYQGILPVAKQLWESNKNTWLKNYLAMAKYIDNWAKNNEQKKPLLVGCVKVNKYIKAGGLI